MNKPETVFVTTVGTFIGNYNPSMNTPDTYFVQDCVGIKTKHEGDEQADVIFLPYHRLISSDLCISISKRAVTTMFSPNKQLRDTYNEQIKKIEEQR